MDHRSGLFSSESPFSEGQHSLFGSPPASQEDLNPYNTSKDTLEELQKLLNDPEGNFGTKSSHPYSSSYNVGNLEERILHFQHSQQKSLENYVERACAQRASRDNLLLLLDGWEDVNLETLKQLPFDQVASTSGGFYFRWNQQGVVVNPGRGFLKRFHSHGFYITDIDYVIVTRDSKEAHEDLLGIYELNHQLNLLNPSFHLIQYFLESRAHEKLAVSLKPYFKQERSSVHSLDLFIDSHAGETVDLSPSLRLNYHTLAGAGSLAVQFELLDQGSSRSYTKIGYVSHAGYTPQLSNALRNSTILIAALQETSQEDRSRATYRDKCLGYFGIYTLAQEIAPDLLICTEFSGKDGDIRLEVVKRLREELSRENRNEKDCLILPADIGLRVNLETSTIANSLTGEPVDSREVRVIKSAESFGPLHYISTSGIL